MKTILTNTLGAIVQTIAIPFYVTLLIVDHFSPFVRPYNHDNDFNIGKTEL